MFLAIDIGNTNIKCGIYDNNDLIKIYKVPSVKPEIEEFFEFLKNYDIKTSVISSVVPELDNKVINLLNYKYKIKTLSVNFDTNTGIKIKLPKPQELGADRIVNACAAYNMYSKALIVIDAGSAITFDIIDNEGNFFGGIIMPGVNMQLKALHSYTSKLPLIELDDIENIVASNTKDAILAGTVIATACAIDGLIKRVKQKLDKDIIIVGTGGNAEFLQKYMEYKFDYINSNLTLEGLKYIGIRNFKTL